ncbi:O-antigen polymerase [Dietzia sp. ANT_WB102]|uniref:O-antigen polymerase n=1 Tax=Dietzia sp. ANT_WB102 TaxID=2597345 RepID=UPI0011EF7C69|nr:O-antigen polymerase [Dietzia sp. ANT_WB102]KAA0918902.1 oligosaccharide repeat unit polymerase [Dietzia sp. ANT_WB102]
MLLIITFSAALTIAHYVINSRKLGMWTPDSIFVPLQLTMVVGTALLVNPDNPTEVQYTYLVTAAFACYVTASLAFGTLIPRRIWSRPKVNVRAVSAPRLTFYFWFTLSALVSVAYFQAIGYNTLLVSLESFLSGADVDVATLRIESYSGSRYLFPGYVNQFKNALLPALTIVLVHWLIQSKSPLRYVAGPVAAAFAALMLLGTGQRGASILAALMVIAYLFNSFGRRALRYVAAFFTAFVPLLFVATLANGRTDISQNQSPLQAVGALADQLQQRVLVDNQFSGINAFHYTHSFPTQHGLEWLQSLKGLLPGVEGSNLSHAVFEMTYGSDRGTAPPSLWGSVHYNFGVIGTILVPIILAAIFVAASAWIRSLYEVDALGMIGIAGVSVVCGMWRAGDPTYLLNFGIVPFMVLAYIGTRPRRIAQGTSSQPLSTRARRRPVTAIPETRSLT